MDDFFIHLAPLPRRFPHFLPVTNIGYIPQKRNWVRQTFDSFNFSFILSGVGEYRTADRVWPVKTPCVITQWPGIHVEYGPSPVWEELFLIYHKGLLPRLKAAGMANPDKPVWYIHDSMAVNSRMVELRERFTHIRDFGCPDQLDRLCESMVLESLISEARPAPDPREQAIRKIQSWLHDHYREEHDFDRLALDHGMSTAHFRRWWNQLVSVPPAHYLMQFRIERACRLLAETTLSVREVASTVGFRDPLYFSRRFHRALGMTATAYRRRNRSPFSSRPAEKMSRQKDVTTKSGSAL
jgi:AraC-like DNA-binding protein